MTGSPRPVTVVVTEVVTETPEAKSLLFDPLGAAFDYQPGQFVTVRIPSELTGSVARSYSLFTSPYAGELPGITVKRTAAGFGSNWLCDNIAPGDQLELLPPSGVFTPDSLEVPLLLLAAGSGITPVMSILTAALQRGSAHITLLYANYAPADTIFRDTLLELETEHAARLTIVWWFVQDRGVPTADDLAALLSPYHSRDAFLCGREEFMHTVREALRVIGTPRELIHQEIYSSMARNPFEDTATADSPQSTDPGGRSSGREPEVVVHNLGASFTIAWPRERNLVDVLLDAGYDVPFSCQAGTCSTCMCKLVEGTVEMAVTEALMPEDLDDGYILGCQAKPTSDALEVEF